MIKEKENSSRAKNSLASGAIAGFTSVLALQPLDVVKTRLQETSKSAEGWSQRVSKVLVGTIKEDGLQGFWRGTLPTLMRNVPGVAIYFLTLQQLQYLVIVGHQRGFPIINRLYDAEGRKLSTVGNLVAGAVARTSAGTLLLPTTVLKVRFESRQYRYNSLLEACKEIWISDGLKGFFRGLGATALRDAPHAGLYLAFYEALKESIPSDTTLGKLACGSLAGFLATATTQPFDLAKTRVQLSKERVNFITIISRVIKSEGLLGLFNGMAPRLLRKSLSSAVTWTVYEELLTWYQQNYN